MAPPQRALALVLKLLDLGAACHSTSTKVRDEGPFAIYYIVIYSVKT